MHFLVCVLGFLEGSDESCDFAKAVVLGTSSVERAGGLVIRFHNSFWAGDLGRCNHTLFLAGAVAVNFYFGKSTHFCWLQWWIPMLS